MATEQMIDQVAVDMHQSVLQLYLAKLRAIGCDHEPDLQAAMLAGAIAGICHLSWMGRDPQAMPPIKPADLVEAMRRTALDFLEQFAADERSRQH